MPAHTGKRISKQTATKQGVSIGSFQGFPAIPIERKSHQSIEQGRGSDMFANRRKSERRASRNIAKIQLGTGLPRDCVITDISDGGVKVIAEHLEIPPEFTIILSAGRPRQCRLAWGIGCEFGAQFVD